MSRYLPAIAKFALAYLILLAITAWLGRWDAEFLQGRDLWHFGLSRMVVPFIALGVFAAFARLVPSALLLASILLIIGTASAIKREATGEPFQVSDLFLAEQSTHLFAYVSWQNWLMGIWIFPAAIYYFRNLRFTRYSLPVFALCFGLLSTYRIETVVKFIHDNGVDYGIENLTFSQAESERMNGIATHLYFSTAGVWVADFTADEVAAAMDRLIGAAPVAAQEPKPDIYIVLGEAWWRDPTDTQSPLNRLAALGFAEGQAISPIYGGTTPNAEFEVLTGVSMKAFRSGIIPFQHYNSYFSKNARTLPRLLVEHGYTARAYHNYTPRFWLRDQNYPRLGFESFDSSDEMGLTITKDIWPTDDHLYAKVLEHSVGEKPQFAYVVTVETHGPYRAKPDCHLPGKHGACDYHNRLNHAVTAFSDFVEKVKARGRPFAIIAFGDHLPGTRMHQIKMGIKSNQDPRLHQVPVLSASSEEGMDKALRDRLNGKPLFCFPPLISDTLKLGIDDRFFLHLVKTCDEGTAGVPEMAVIQRQLFD
jgi:hypothetical protein